MTEPAGPGPTAPPPLPPAPAPAAPPDTPPVAPGEPASAGDGAPAAAGPAPEPESYAVGAGDQAAEATSRYGQGSQRGGYLRGAAGWGTGGDDAGGGNEYFQGVKNYYYLGHGSESAVSPLPPRLGGLVEKAFVPPACMAEVQAAFDRRNVVVLRGPNGCGKLGLAIRLLSESCDVPLLQVDESADLARLREWIQTGEGERRRVATRAGFIVDSPQGAAHLHGSVLEGLEKALDDADARLVLTVGPEVALAEKLHDYVIDVTSGPDCEVVVESHLRHLLTAQEAEELLAPDAIRLFIREELGPSPTCHLAAYLASAIAKAVTTAEKSAALDIASVRAVMSQRGSEAFDNWFISLGDTQSRCFAVALAVLNGYLYDVVAKAARALWRRFDSHPYTVTVSSGEPVPDIKRPFLLSRREWLHRLQARAGEGTVEGSYGPSYADTVEFLDDTYPQRLIERAWSDYRAQGTLIAWLGELAQDSLDHVRILAGRTLGLLALRSFDHLSLTVFEPWAAGPVRQREAVAYALRFAAAGDPRRHENVRQLVAGWYADARRPLAQATAARAYGLIRGAISQDEAFAALGRLATVEDIRVAVAVGHAIVDMLDDGTDGFACHVLGTLASYLDDRKRSATVQLVFLIAAASLERKVRPKGQQRETSWPFLLYLATVQPSARDALIRLWKYVLNGSLFVDEASQVMTEWAKVTEADPQTQEVFLRLVQAIAAGDRRSQMIFGRYAAVWASDGNFTPIPRTSAAVQAILNAERVPR